LLKRIITEAIATVFVMGVSVTITPQKMFCIIQALMIKDMMTASLMAFFILKEK
jgi:hypothetical protein